MAPIVQKWLAAEGLAAKREFVVPWGICDFVGVALRETHVRKRLALGQTRPIGPLERIRLLQSIPDRDSGRAVTVASLERQFQSIFSGERVREEISKLVESRFAEFTRRSSVHRLNGWEPLHRRIIAIELKLSRPQEALEQAVSHLAFADEAFVAFPFRVAKRLSEGSHAQDFTARGVGILGIDEFGCHLLRRPTGRHFAVDPSLQMLCVERFWRAKSYKH